jgi:hypothetical protein
MNEIRYRPELTGADLTRLCWLLYVHGGRRERLPYGEPRKNAAHWEAYGLATIEVEDPDVDRDFVMYNEHVEITDNGRAVCEAMVAAGRNAAENG